MCNSLPISSPFAWYLLLQTSNAAAAFIALDAGQHLQTHVLSSNSLVCLRCKAHCLEMGEALAAFGVAASVAQFVAITCEVVSRIENFTSTTKNTLPVLEDLQHQLPLMRDICQRLLQQDDGVAVEPSVDHVIQGCIRQVEILDTLIKTILPHPGDSKFTRIRKAVASYTKHEKQLREASQSLERYKTTLTLYVNQAHSTASSPSAPPTLYEVPSSEIQHFVGRKDYLDQISSEINPQRMGKKPRTVCLLGMGGQGKTQLALRICRTMQGSAAGEFHATLWIDANSIATITRSFQRIAERITGGERSFDSEDAVVRFVIYTISETWKVTWLMVFDNLDRPDLVPNIGSYFPTRGQGAILITSRHQDTRRLAATTIPITSMTEEDGLELLFSQTRATRSVEGLEQARIIVKKLGHLPLALDQAAAYMVRLQLPFGMFLKDFDKLREQIFKHTPDLWEYKRSLTEAEVYTSLSAFTTWELSVQAVGLDEQERCSITHLLTLFAFLNHTRISESIFKTHFQTLDNKPAWMNILATEHQWDSYKYRQIVGDLLKLSLLQGCQTKSECLIILHPLISEWMQLRLDSDDRRKYTIEAIELLTSFVVSQKSARNAYDINRELLSHLDKSLRNDSNYLSYPKTLGHGSLRNQGVEFALFYNLHGMYKNAELLLLRAVGKEDSEQEANSQELEILLHLSDVYRNLGRYTETEALALRVVRTRVAEFGEENLLTIEAVTHLARSLSSMARYVEAERLFIKARTVHQKVLGPEHPDTLRDNEDLAGVYRSQGRNDEAARTFQAVLFVKESTMGSESPTTAQTLSSLASVYRVQCETNLAELVGRRALKTYRKCLGPVHPKTVNELQNLAITLRNKGEYSECETLLQDSLEISHRGLGANHPQTSRAISNLGVLYEKWNRLDEAERLIKQALEHRERILGAHHPTTVRTAEALGHVYLHQKRYRKAGELFPPNHQSKDDSTLDVNSPEPARTAALLFQAENAYKQALDREQTTLSADHPDFLGTLISLGRVYEGQQRSPQAARLFDQAYQASATRFGKDHIYTTRALLYLKETSMSQ